MSCLLLVSAVLVLVSCTRPATQGVDAQIFLVQGDDPRVGQRIPISAGDSIFVPESGGYFWLLINFDSWNYPGDSWMSIIRPSTAVEFFVNGIKLDASGRFPPDYFIESGRSTLFRIPAGLITSGTIPQIGLRMFSDGGVSKTPHVTVIDDTSEVATIQLFNILSIDIYRYLSILAFFIFIFFLVQFIQRVNEITNLFFALFNLFIGFYYLGLGNTWLGLPFWLTVGFTRACLFLAISAMVMFCLSFTKHPSRLLLISAAVIGLLLAGNLIGLAHNLIQARNLFNFALLPGMAMLLAALIYLFGLFRKGSSDLLPLLIGGVIALASGIYDSVFTIIGIKPWFWLQGLGIFLFQLSVFMTIVNRTTRMRVELEGYARGIEAEVDRRTSQLHETNIALSKANTAKSEFLAHMSHEIRTPLNCIMGFGQMLEQHLTDPDDSHNVQLILQESEHLMQLINHILDFSRIENGKLVLDNQPFDPVEAINQVLEGFKPIAISKGLEIMYAAGSGIPEMVSGDILRFQQVLINLVGNALKFTENGFVKISLDAKKLSRNSEHELKIQIIDSGIGIPSDRLGSIFNSFEQADTSITRRFGGSGLGITIARDLILLMNGTIQVKSQVGIGTSIEYTVHLGSEKANRHAPTSNKGEGFRRDFGLMYTVLVVEDYQTNLEVIRLFLGNARIKCLEANSGAAALEMMALFGKDINAILMDVHMPDMDGFETTRQIKANPDFTTVPIIALTADAFDETGMECRKAGMIDVLTKPVRYPDLIACLEKALVSEPSPPTTHGSKSTHDDQPVTVVSAHQAGLKENPVDLNQLRDVFFDDIEVIGHLLSGFIEAGEKLILELRDGIDAHNLAIVHMKAHALKGGALNIFATDLAASAEKLERMARQRQSHGLHEQYQQVILDWQGIKDWWHTQNSISKT